MNKYQKAFDSDTLLKKIRDDLFLNLEIIKKEYDKDFFTFKGFFSSKYFKKITKQFKDKCDKNRYDFSSRYQRRADEIIEELSI